MRSGCHMLSRFGPLLGTKQSFLGSESENDALFTVPSPFTRVRFLGLFGINIDKKDLNQIRLKDSNMTQDEPFLVGSWMIKRYCKATKSAESWRSFLQLFWVLLPV